jgi:hypothetical protein
VNVPEGKVQALWCGMQIPEDAVAGKYAGRVTVSTENAAPQTVNVVIRVEKGFLADRGDGELWRHSRLRWLNSTIGRDDLPVSPYGKMQLEGNRITATGKTLLLASNGLPQSIEINDRKIFSQPVAFVVSAGKRDIPFVADNLKIEKAADGLVRWTAYATRDGLTFDCEARMEYDGYMRYNIRLSADREMTVNDVRLIASYTPGASAYFMGTGYRGGNRPARYAWDWKGPWDSYWTGDYDAGLHVEYRGGSYHGPLINDYKPAAPEVWANAGKGRILVSGAAGQTATVTASTGACTVSDTPLNFEFGMLITPVKPVNPAKHFSERYFHSNPDHFAKAAEDGANICNIHHARTLNHQLSVYCRRAAD